MGLSVEVAGARLTSRAKACPVFEESAEHRSCPVTKRAVARLAWRRWLAYAAFWLGIGLFFSLAEWQHYVRGGGPHPWEPFLWEMSL